MARREIKPTTSINAVLLASAVITLAALASYPVFYGVGMWSGVTPAYIVIVTGTLILCIVALIIANAVDAITGLVFYVWCGLGAIIGMVTLDILNGSREFPWILYCLLAGIFGLGYFDVGSHKYIYTIVTVLIVMLAGAIYRQYDQAIACALSAAFIALLGRWRER